jgi:hypothetical protein
MAAPLSAQADEAGAHAALNKALTRAVAETQSTPRLAFTETVAEKGVTVSARFNPALMKSRAWSPLSPLVTRQETTTYRGIVHDTPDERDLLLGRVARTIAGPGRLISETGGAAVFDFALSPQARPTNSMLDTALGLAQHIRVRLTVDEAKGAFAGMTFYAPGPFSATPLAHVSRLSLQFGFGESYPGGPIVVRRIDTDAGYDVVGVAKSVRDTIWFKDVAPAPNAAPLVIASAARDRE